MSSDSNWTVQAGVFSQLTGTPALTALLAAGAGGIFDHVPAGAAFPYVVLGEMASSPLDTAGVSGNEISLAIHAYSRKTGMQQVRAIMQAVYDSLHDADFAVTGQSLVLCRCKGSSTQLGDDGLTRHGTQHFRIITEPA
jgi:hypothetical protein